MPLEPPGRTNGTAQAHGAHPAFAPRHQCGGARLLFFPSVPPFALACGRRAPPAGASSVTVPRPPAAPSPCSRDRLATHGGLLPESPRGPSSVCPPRMGVLSACLNPLFLQDARQIGIGPTPWPCCNSVTAFVDPPPRSHALVFGAWAHEFRGRPFSPPRPARSVRVHPACGAPGPVPPTAAITVCWDKCCASFPGVARASENCQRESKRLSLKFASALRSVFRVTGNSFLPRATTIAPSENMH